MPMVDLDAGRISVTGEYARALEQAKQKAYEQGRLQAENDYIKIILEKEKQVQEAIEVSKKLVSGTDRLLDRLEQYGALPPKDSLTHQFVGEDLPSNVEYRGTVRNQLRHFNDGVEGGFVDRAKLSALVLVSSKKIIVIREDFNGDLLKYNSDLNFPYYFVPESNTSSILESLMIPFEAHDSVEDVLDNYKNLVINSSRTIPNDEEQKDIDFVGFVKMLSSLIPSK